MTPLEYSLVVYVVVTGLVFAGEFLFAATPTAPRKDGFDDPLEVVLLGGLAVVLFCLGWLMAPLYCVGKLAEVTV